MRRALDRFVVFLKHHGERSLLAYGYSENKESGRTIFHRDPDLKDSETYFLTSEISGIEREVSEGEIKVGFMTHEEFNRMVENLPTGETDIPMSDRRDS
jgi:hypothetical protein